MQRLLVVEDDNSVRTTISTFLELEGYSVDAVSSTREAMERLRDDAYPIVISDIYLDERTGIDVLHRAREKEPALRGDPDDRARHHGNRDGRHPGRGLRLHRQALRTGPHAGHGEARRGLRERSARQEKESEIDDLPDSEMIGSSPSMIEIYKTISRVAPTTATVLIEGETGTGKEMIARMIHANSPRAQQPFVPVDCGSIAPSLIESELFGAMRGAYTGADRDRIGVFEAANGGTVFLDEIGDIEIGIPVEAAAFPAGEGDPAAGRVRAASGWTCG